VSAPPPGAELARLETIPDAGAIVVDVGGVSVLLTRRGAQAFAYINRCTHAHYPLDENGRVLVQEARYIVCPQHGASYELDTGKCAGGPCNGAGLTPVPVEMRAGAAFVAIPRE
jgi:nitrite reductase/ring-hydroxylating ferredoxin subunit